MPRMRYLKPSFFTDADLAEFSPLHRLAFEGLWCHADREGRLEDKPRELKIQILPYDDCDFERLLADLARPKGDGPGFIVRYSVGGRRIIAVTKWERHQKPHPKESVSDLPPPPPSHASGTSRVITRLDSGQTMSGQDPATGQSGGDGDGDGDGDFNGDGERNEAAAPLALLPRESPADLQRIWNEEAHPDLPRWREVTKGREKHARLRIGERGLEGPMGYRAVVRRVSASAFCRGHNDRGWRADPDWLLRPDTAAKVLEGKYDDRKPGTGPPRDFTKGRVGAEEIDWTGQESEVGNGF